MLPYKLRLTVFDKSDALHEASAVFILEQAQQAVEKRGRFVIALSGGDTPLSIYTLLSKDPFLHKMPWDQTFIFWGDERCVPEQDVRNNAFQAKMHWLDKIHFPKKNIHRMPVGPTPEAAAQQYEKDIQLFFENEEARFDLILLGLGENGHTASLFPGMSVLQEKQAGIRAIYIDEQKEFRITMTAPMINHSRQILFIVCGSKKAAILHKVLKEGHTSDQFPVLLIQPDHGRVAWFVDREAASALHV